MNFQKIARIIFGLIGLMLMAFGIALLVALSEGSFVLGQYPFETLGLTILEGLQKIGVTQFNIGDWSVLMNGSFFILLIALRKKHDKLHWTILKGLIPVFVFSLPMGWFLSLMADFVTATIVPLHALRIVLYIAAMLVANLGNAMFQVANIANFPLNDWNEEYAIYKKISFAKIRIFIDGGALLISVILTLLLSNSSFYIGWATPLLMVLTGPLLGFYLKFLRKNISFIEKEHSLE